MKTQLYNLLKWITIGMMAFTLTSCEGVFFEVELDDDDDDYISRVDSATEYLTSRVWVDSWTDSEGTYYQQELRFSFNGTGRDYLYSEDRFGYIKETSYDFLWDWRNSNCTSIRLKYGPGDYSLMTHISMRGNELSCLFDGQSAYFRGR